MRKQTHLSNYEELDHVRKCLKPQQLQFTFVVCILGLCICSVRILVFIGTGFESEKVGFCQLFESCASGFE